MKVGGDNDHYSYIADNYNHMTFLCKGKCRRYKQFFICFYKGASLRRYYPGQVVRGRKVKSVSGKVHVYENRLENVIITKK